MPSHSPAVPQVGDAATVVAIAVGASSRGLLTRIVEGTLGWTVAPLDDPSLPPSVVVTDVAGAGGVGAAVGPGGAALVVLVGSGDDPVAAAAAGRRADACLPWPPAAESLAAVARTARSATIGERARTGAWCTIAGAAGGVGTTAIALALGALRAWDGKPTLVVASGPSHVADAPSVAPDDLDAPALWGAARPVTAVPGLRVVRVTGPVTTPPVVPDGRTVGDAGGVPGGVLGTVLDVGVAPHAVAPDVLVVGRDRAGLDAAATTPARVVLAVGNGPVDRRPLELAAAGRTVLLLRDDPRVARACHAGRHPTDAPRSWLTPLVQVVAAHDRVAP